MLCGLMTKLAMKDPVTALPKTVSRVSDRKDTRDCAKVEPTRTKKKSYFGTTFGRLVPYVYPDKCNNDPYDHFTDFVICSGCSATPRCAVVLTCILNIAHHFPR